MSAAERPDLTRLLSLGAACGLLVAAVSGLWPWVFQVWEDKTLDLRFALRNPIPTDSRLILIDSDDTSVAALGRWPWDRAVHALMVEILSSVGAKAIAYDVVFSVPSSVSDLRFMKVIAQAKNVYLPIGVELFAPGSEGVSEAELAQMQSLLSGVLGSSGLPWLADGNSGDLLVTGKLFMSSADLTAAAVGVGHIASNRDPDGVIRRVPLVVRVKDRLLPAFSLRVAMDVLGVKPQNVAIVPGRYVQLSGVEADPRKQIRIPIDERGQMLVNYAGKWTETFLPHYGFSEVLGLAATPEGRRKIEARFKGATVLILTTATGFDLKTVPLELAVPGGTVHANALNTILTARWLYSPSTAEVSLWVVLMGVAGALVVSGRFWKLPLAGVAAGNVVYLGLAIVAFQLFGRVLPIVAPMTAFLLSVVVVPVQGQARVRARLARLERQIRDTESALTASRARLESHDREFDVAIDEARRLREAARETAEKVHEVEAKTRDLDGALQKAHVERDRLVAQVEELEQRLQDMRPMTPASTVILSTDEEAVRAEAEAYGIVIGDRRMIEVFQMVKKVAPASSAVLLTGETGTGKELVARALHALSPRGHGPFVAVNMAAITETLAESELFGHVKGAFTGAHADKKGRFEQADRGTLFLDEIGELSPDLQAKLLRVLQSGEVDRVGGADPRHVDVRIIAATNRNLEEEVRAKRFREDLYYRLNVVQVVLPPLRDRPDDVQRLARHFLREFADRAGKPILGFSERAMQTLRRQEWRGNVRDLRNAVERAVVFADDTVISEADLGLGTPSEAVGRVILAGAANTASASGRDISGDGAFLDFMRESRFEIDLVAKRLGISRGTVASRFKGLCFQTIVARDGLIADAAADLAGAKDPRVEAKVREYYDNLMETAREFPNAEVAVLECRRRFKNLPQRYFPAVEQLIRRRFTVTTP